MTINIFNLAFAQPLVLGALILLGVVSISALLPPYEEEANRFFIFFPRFKLFYKLILAAAVTIWLAVVVLNHQTFLGDVLNFIFLLGFSIIWLYVMLFAYLLCFAILCILSGVVLFLCAFFVFVITGVGYLFFK